MLTKKIAHVPMFPPQNNLGLSVLFTPAQWTLIAEQFLRCDISHRCEHRDATMLKLSLTTALEVLYAAIGCESCGVPKSDGSLNTQLILECVERDLHAGWAGLSTLAKDVSNTHATIK